MALPETPSVALALLAALNGNAYNASTNPSGLANGGHRQNWGPGMNAMADVGDWVALLAIVLEALAEQVGEDAAAAAAGSGTEATIAALREGTAAFYASIRRIYAAGAPVALVDGATVAWDMASGINFSLTLGAAGRALANPSSEVVGKSGVLLIKQDATGGRSITGWGNQLIWIGGEPDWPTAPNAITLISYFVSAENEVLLSFGGSSA